MDNRTHEIVGVDKEEVFKIMNNIIQYLQETCIKRFEEIQKELFCDSTQVAQFVSNIDDEVKKLGIKVIQQS
ncbi:MAG: hypothetical protein ACI4E1_10585 [Lachnospira sp.]